MEIEQEACSMEQEETNNLQRQLSKFDKDFFRFCDKELTEINTFYSEGSSSPRGDLSGRSKEQHLAHRISYISGEQSDDENTTMQGLTLTEYYLSLVQEEDFQRLNFTGFRKNLKNQDRNMGLKWRSDFMEVANFKTCKDDKKPIKVVEPAIISSLEKCQKRLSVTSVAPIKEKLSPWTTYKVGLFSGAFIVLFATILVTYIARDYEGVLNRGDWRVVCRLYRGPLIVIMFIFLLGVNIYGWRSSGVNYIVIFELDPSTHLSDQHLMELASILGVIWTLSVLTFVYSDVLNIPAYVNPLVLAIFMILFLFNPIKILRHESRFWLLRILGRIACAPFFAVAFADFWMADQLNSLMPVFGDFHYMACFYGSSNSTLSGDWMTAIDSTRCVTSYNWVRPIIMALPAWFRFAQCLRRYRDSREAFPHLANAAKYSTTIFVILFAFLYTDTISDPSLYLWIMFSVVSSLYTYTWDIKMDWGFFHKDTGENRFLREKIIYSKKSLYYIAIVENLLLRFGWVISISLHEKVKIHGDLLISIFAPLEVIRRFIWNFFRLENEQINNCGKFRGVHDISLAQFNASDEALIISMMHEDESSYGIFLERQPPIPRPQGHHSEQDKAFNLAEETKEGKPASDNET